MGSGTDVDLPGDDRHVVKVRDGQDQHVLYTDTRFPVSILIHSFKFCKCDRNLCCSIDSLKVPDICVDLMNKKQYLMTCPLLHRAHPR